MKFILNKNFKIIISNNVIYYLISNVFWFSQIKKFEQDEKIKKLII